MRAELSETVVSHLAHPLIVDNDAPAGQVAVRADRRLVQEHHTLDNNVIWSNVSIIRM